MDSKSLFSSSNESSLETLPIELLYEVLVRLEPKDLEATRLISRHLDSVISMHSKYLARPPFHVTIYGEGDRVRISHNRLGHRKTIVEDFVDFDFTRWQRIEISKLEIRDLEKSSHRDCLSDALELLVEKLSETRNTIVGTLSLHQIKSSSCHAALLRKLFDLILPNTQNLVIEDSHLPIAISKYFSGSTGKNALVHYRWLNSTSETVEQNNRLVLKKFANDISGEEARKNFHFEVNEINPATVCDFIEDWTRAENAAFFNLFLHGCDRIWKEKMVFELRLRRMEGHFLEFPSKTHANAHVKMVFDESSNMCRLWPIFDVPARTAGQLICYARFYRDF